jgi:glutamate 5-kinase
MHPDRVVIKIGTSSLVDDGHLAPDKADAVAAAVADLMRAGVQPVLVASGAIALGRAKLGTRPGRELGAGGRQLAAAVGQGVLFEALRSRLARHSLMAAQILFTPVDLCDDQHCHSIKAVLVDALDRRMVPVVNENDTVQIRNNDILAALLSVLLRARLLALLTDVPGLYRGDPRTDATAQLVPEVNGMTLELERLAGASGSGVGTGGMISKLGALWIATLAGVRTAIVGAQEPDVLPRLLRGEPVGTVVYPRPPVHTHRLEPLWRAFASPPRGTVVCARAARRTIADGRPVPRHLVVRAEGAFAGGDVIDVAADDGRVIARGRARLGALSLTEAASASSADDAVVLHHSEYVSLLEVR